MFNVAVFAFEKISLFHLSVPSAIFSDAHVQIPKPFDVKICAEHTGQLTTSNGLNITVDNDLNCLANADILIFPSWEPKVTPSDALLTIIQQANTQGKIIAALCLGTYVLAHAGILDNKQATTHWAYGEDLKQRFPNIIYQDDPLYIKQDNIITSAGTAAAIDCCLNMLKDLTDIKLANNISRMMVSAPQRVGGQKQFLSKPIPTTSSDTRISLFVEQVLSDLSLPYSLEQAAKACFMSRRSFTRHFRLSFSMGFSEWLNQARLNYSQELLESSNLTIGQIAQEAGFSSEQNFRKQFKATYAITPKDWRKAFR